MTRETPARHRDVETAVAAAADAADAVAALAPARRAEVLEHLADALAAQEETLVPIARAESHLPEPRLRGELLRTCFQLRLFADVLREGAHLDARIDHADPDWPMGAPRPDLRRVLEPIGPVAVFAASNFPFAFSVAGGDTASALAAGNPVVVKAHPGHPELSDAVAGALREALAAEGLPAGVLGVVHGFEAGPALVTHPRIRAAGFTGSIPGGRALFDLACSRAEPIPFYGELGSNNPVVITPGADAARAAELAAGFIGSFTLGAGQFCTKPGTLLVPAGARILEHLGAAELPAAQDMLGERIAEGFSETLAALREAEGVEVLRAGEDGRPAAPAPTLLRTSGRCLLEDPETLEAECFGPAALVVEYEDAAQLREIARSFTGQLTATLHAEAGEDVAELLAILSRRAGRVLWGGWPTGVSVTHAQQHGGPYPASTAVGSTSVGTAAISRFLRPVAYQDLPDALLPPALQEANPLGIPRLVDGERVPGTDSGRRTPGSA